MRSTGYRQPPQVVVVLSHRPRSISRGRPMARRARAARTYSAAVLSTTLSTYSHTTCARHRIWCWCPGRGEDAGRASRSRRGLDSIAVSARSVDLVLWRPARPRFPSCQRRSQSALLVSIRSEPPPDFFFVQILTPPTPRDGDARHRRSDGI